MTMTATAARTNRYAAPCADCGVWIRENAGLLAKNARTGKWETRHDGECPAPVAKGAPAKNAEPGYYVRPADGRAVVVVANKAGTRTYGKVLTFPEDGSRPSWVYTPGAGYTVADLRPMTAADAAEMGLSSGYCIKCCAPLGGETLGAAISALIGYGETCAKNFGFPYPKGVKAQRAYMAEHGR